MIHDCTITERYLVLVLAPVIFDLDAMTTGGDVLAWKPEMGTRIACIPRDGGAVQWIHTDPFFVWHFGNAYDDGDDVVVDFSWWSSFGLDPGPGLAAAPSPGPGSRPQRGGRAHPPGRPRRASSPASTTGAPVEPTGT